MIERLLENWLDKTTERSFQIPFSYILLAEGHNVVHITRHCGMEMGKDIISIAPDKIPCAFQLKSAYNRKITQSMWRKIKNQIIDLVYNKINHPSVNSRKHHNSYVVTNGFLDEEVIRDIDDFNNTLQDKDIPKLVVISRGDILDKIKKYHANIWPSELRDTKILLEIYLETGKGNIPKDKLASLFESVLPLDYNFSKLSSKRSCLRTISSCALLCGITTSEYSNNNNYFAEIEAWTMYASYVIACAERWKLDKKYWIKEIDIAHKIIYNSMNNIFEEIRERKHLIKDSAVEDFPFYKCRITLLIALMSILGIWRKINNEQENDIDKAIRQFCLEKINSTILWGEGAVVQLLAFFWYYRTIDATPKPDFFLASIIRSILEAKKIEEETPEKSFLANPYYNAEEIVPVVSGFSEWEVKDSFQGESYTLEGLMHLFVRRNWKQNMKLLWPGITRISFMSFQAEEKWQYCIWKTKKGTTLTKQPKLTQNWNELKKIACENKGSSIPDIFKHYPILFLLFLVVYPHRATPDALRWLDYELTNSL